MLCSELLLLELRAFFSDSSSPFKLSDVDPLLLFLGVPVLFWYPLSASLLLLLLLLLFGDSFFNEIVTDGRRAE